MTGTGCRTMLLGWLFLTQVGYSTLEFAMNIELEEVVVQDVSDDALELAAGGAQGGGGVLLRSLYTCCSACR